MATLERRLGLKLLERTTSGSRLTSDGAMVTDWARRVLEQAEALVEGAEALRTHADERLAVAASLTIAEHLVPKWLIELRQLRPATRVGLTVENSHQVVGGTAGRRGRTGIRGGDRGSRATCTRRSWAGTGSASWWRRRIRGPAAKNR